MLKKVLFIVALSLAIIVPSYGQDGETKRIAVLETVDKENSVSYSTKLIIRSNLTAVITSTPGYEGYDRVDVSSIMEEHEFQRTGLVGDADIKRLGEMTGADYILVTEVVSLENSRLFITSKILNVESAQIDKTANVESSESSKELEKNCRKLAGKLFGVATTATTTTATDTKGELTLEEGIYVGEIQNGKPHGEGRLTYSDDSTNIKYYEGDWVNGKKHGHGTMEWKDNEKYVGQWKSDERCGAGKYYYSDGSRYEGNWAKNERNGVGTYYFSNGDRYEGEWMHRLKHGEGTTYYASGELTKATHTWAENRRFGPATEYTTDGYIHKGSYNVNGNKDGEWKCYKFNKLQSTMIYSDGKLKRTIRAK